GRCVFGRPHRSAPSPDVVAYGPGCLGIAPRAVYPSSLMRCAALTARRVYTMPIPDDWLDLETDLHSPIMAACVRQGLAEDLARLIAIDALVECRQRIVERVQVTSRRQNTPDKT